MRVVARQRARMCLDSEIRKPCIRPVEESNEMSGSGVWYANNHDVIKVNVIQIKLSINYSVPFCTIGDLK